VRTAYLYWRDSSGAGAAHQGTQPAWADVLLRWYTWRPVFLHVRVERLVYVLLGRREDNVKYCLFFEVK
jgi:hypothetical protein